MVMYMFSLSINICNYNYVFGPYGSIEMSHFFLLLVNCDLLAFTQLLKYTKASPVCTSIPVTLSSY